jgi:transposase-like protein
MQRNPHVPHSIEFKEQALFKARQRGSRTLESIANELNMSVGTLKNWLKVRNKAAAPTLNGSTTSWTPEQRLQALHESHALSGSALHAWCREKGLFEHQLTQWREEFCRPSASPARESTTALRELQRQHEQLQRELRRKDKALAETAALLVLQKKFQALLEGEDK